jgi:competence protein ComEC
MAVLVCAAASAAGVALRESAVASGPVRALAMRQATASLDAVVTGDPRALPRPGAVRHRETILIPARVERVERRRVRVPVLLLAADPAWKRVLPSQRVQVIARLSTPHPGELLAAVALVRGPPALSGRPSRLQRTAAVIRARLRSATDRLPSDQHAVLPALVDGDTSLVPPDLADAFAKAGLTHLMAVSGENLSLLIGAVLAFGRFAGLGRRAAPVAAGLAILGFVVVARPSPSVLRAAVMGAVALIAVITGREHRGVPALCAAVLVLVLIDPELAQSYGFALSAVATAGILLLAPRWRRKLSERMPRRLAESLAVSAAAQAVCLPLLVMLGEGIDLVAVPANLLAAPAVGPATLLGVLTALIAPISLPAARLIAALAGFAVGWITGVARVLSLAPYTSVGWPAGITGAVLVLVAFALVAYVARRPLPRRIAAVALIGIALSALGTRILAPAWPPRGWRFVTCDVGQGDGLALFTGPGQAVVVDTGPDPRPMDRCLRDLGVRTVPLLVLTHPHADHVDGIPGVLHGRAVGTIVISPDSEGEERRLLPGSPTRTAGIGDLWTIGPLTLTVLGPLDTGRVSTRDTGTTVNNASVVMLARWPGLTVMLCGDIEIEAQRELLSAGVPVADVLKIPHHGSSHQAPAFLAAVHARIAIASVGAGNDYGHPAPSTMTELSRLGDRTYRTDQDGDVAVIRTDSGLAVVTRHTHGAMAGRRRTRAPFGSTAQ